MLPSDHWGWSSGVRARCAGIGPSSEVVQDPRHDGEILDASDHLDCATAVLAGFDIDLEYPVETLSPHHGSATLGGGIWPQRAFDYRSLLVSPVVAGCRANTP